jgi:hypothetical protein
MNEASTAQTVKNAALLSPCHIQSSHLRAVFCGRVAGFNVLPRGLSSDVVLDLFFRRAMFLA